MWSGLYLYSREHVQVFHVRSHRRLDPVISILFFEITLPKNPTLSHSEALSRFFYDAVKGVLVWVRPTSRRVKPGDLAGRILNCGSGKRYIFVRIHGETFAAHRLILFMETGVWPPQEVDHINGDGLDNRLVNLRLATRVQNCRNRRLPSNNTSGHIGVSWHTSKQRWRVQIKNGHRHHIHVGEFKTIEEAIVARKQAEICIGYHINHGDVRPL